jgi:hypothetical protein
LPSSITKLGCHACSSGHRLILAVIPGPTENAADGDRQSR